MFTCFNTDEMFHYHVSMPMPRHMAVTVGCDIFVTGRKGGTTVSGIKAECFIAVNQCKSTFREAAEAVGIESVAHGHLLGFAEAASPA